LVDGSTVTYYWYKFIEQPVFGQLKWSADERAALQATIERMHRAWRIDGTYMAPPRAGALVRFDANLLVMPPKGMEIGFVPIVTKQELVVKQGAGPTAKP